MNLQLKFNGNVLNLETNSDVVTFSDTTLANLFANLSDTGKKILAAQTPADIRRILKTTKDRFFDDAGRTWINSGCGTAVNNAKFGYALNVPSGKYIINNQKIYLGGQDFTLEYWAFFNSASTIFAPPLAFVSNSTDGQQGPYLHFRRGNGDFCHITYTDSAGNTVFGANDLCGNSPIVGSLRHYELDYIHDSGTWKLFVDGLLENEKTGIQMNRTLFNYIICGMFDTDSQRVFVGQIDEIRISDGIARHTDNFTPADSPHEYDEYTASLLHFDI